MVDFTKGYSDKLISRINQDKSGDDQLNGFSDFKKYGEGIKSYEDYLKKIFDLRSGSDEDKEKLKLLEESFAQALGTSFDDVNLKNELFPNISDRVLAVFTDRLLGLDAARKEQQDVITKLAAQVDLISRAQKEVSELINDKRLKKDTDEITISDSQAQITLTQRDWKTNPALKKVLIEDLKLNPEKFNNPTVNVDIEAIAKFAFSESPSSSQSTVFGSGKKISKNSLRTFSENLSNRSKVLNDLVNEKTVTYQDFSSKYDSTIEAMAKFIEKYFQVSSGLLNRFA